MKDHLPTADELIAEELGLSLVDEEQNPDKPQKTSKKKEDENIIYTSYFENDNYIIEQVVSYNNNNNNNNATRATHATSSTPNGYILFDKASGTTEFTETFLSDGKEYRPIIDDLLKQKVVLLPSGVEEYGETADLVKEIKEFLFEYFEVPKFFQNFLPYLVLFYWVYEKFPFIPYLQFLGRTGTGKSTAMETIGSICYKPIDASGAITTASLFRIAALWRGTLLLDEFNAGGESYQEMLAILKSGVSSKAVLRTEGDGKKEVKAYVMKSPKMFTSERPVTDAGLRSRIIEVKMELNKRKVPLYKQKRFFEKAQFLRNKLLLWRLRNLAKIDLSDIEYGYKELEHFQGRVQHVLTPIYYLSDEEARKEIVTFAQEQQSETLKERRESIEGQCFESIIENYQKGTIPSLSVIAEAINKSNRYPITERKLGNVIRKMLGFKIERLGHANISSVILDAEDEKIEDLCNYYGIPFPKGFSSVASVAQVASGSNSNPEQQELMEEARDLFGVED